MKDIYYKGIKKQDGPFRKSRFCKRRISVADTELTHRNINVLIVLKNTVIIDKQHSFPRLLQNCKSFTGHLLGPVDVVRSSSALPAICVHSCVSHKVGNKGQRLFSQSITRFQDADD